MLHCSPRCGYHTTWSQRGADVAGSDVAGAVGESSLEPPHRKYIEDIEDEVVHICEASVLIVRPPLQQPGNRDHSSAQDIRQL